MPVTTKKPAKGLADNQAGKEEKKVENSQFPQIQTSLKMFTQREKPMTKISFGGGVENVL